MTTMEENNFQVKINTEKNFTLKFSNIATKQILRRGMMYCRKHGLCGKTKQDLN